MPSILHAAVAALAAILPRHEVDATARVGISLITVRHLVLGPGARIGHLNLIRNLDEVRLETRSAIGNLNWVNAVPSSATDTSAQAAT